jgi:hypothetical protein
VSADPSLPLQKAVNAKLVGAAAVTALVGDRIYDRVPAKPTFPFIHLGDDQIIGDDEWGENSDCYVNVHVYSRGVGKVEVKTIAAAVRAALDTRLIVSGFLCGEYQYEETKYITQADGLTEHAIIEFYYSLQEDA